MKETKATDQIGLITGEAIFMPSAALQPVKR